MSEANIIDRTPSPNTRLSLAEDLRTLGVAAGMTVIVHSSLSSIGWVNGGELAVVQALQDVITDKGTIVMPAHSGNLSDPSGWGNPPVPESWWETVRETMPAYDPALTPTWGMGRVAELFRKLPGVLRNSHPQTSFSAWGAQAAYITEGQSLDYGMGEQSPLARIYDLDGYVLLLGVGYDSNTSLHLAEYRADSKQSETRTAPVIDNGQHTWKTFYELVFRTDDFEELGKQFEESGAEVISRKVGQSPAKLLKQRDCVDFGKQWLEENPPQ